MVSELVSLKVYLKAVAGLFNRHPDELLFDFKLPRPKAGVMLEGREENGGGFELRILNLERQYMYNKLYNGFKPQLYDIANY
jgi:hypothetical protein